MLVAPGAFYIDVINAFNRKNVTGYDYWLDSNSNLNRKVIGIFPITDYWYQCVVLIVSTTCLIKRFSSF
ncbi:MAG: hypothetical protein M3P82_04110 [Bacteroidota bacterium]|nr:hypothetical protein [Bacteroidota bacterium]